MHEQNPNQNKKVAYTVIDDEATLVAPDTSLMYWLNPVATRIWELSDSQHSTGKMAEILCNEFEVEYETALQDTTKMLEAFGEKNLIATTEKIQSNEH